MSTTTSESYTAKLTDGPLEGKTIRTGFTNGGEPQPRITIPTDSPAKQYLYIRGNGFEYGSDDASSSNGSSPARPARPTAVEYRFVQAIFE
ncbi:MULTISPECIES: hypothetical protein [Subtercola]|uniref:Uncharacterized protein n=1 Tax=Subtercola vilae TaxID=2056433 RepID=A0A4T2BQZ7_9MICO|nr:MULTISPECIES: hypothetical protein [Subtercola]MEA9986941.1 hypothetical protein [Subtercola sp. RTI3]TIH33660.1 hypothetical protein D4765_14350 [Subtercola vilae]